MSENYSPKRDIAKEAGVNIAMISYYFGSKDKLLEAIFSRHIAAMNQKLNEIVKDKMHDPVEKVALIIDTYIDAITENKDFHSLMQRQLMVLREGVLFDSIRRMKAQNRNLLQSAIKAGVKAGYFRKNTDINMLANTLFGTVNQTFSNRRYLEEVYGIDIDDDAAFEKVVIQKLRNHLKAMFQSFLTYEQSNKK
jgi:AcrR family transcriptional regulator